MLWGIGAFLSSPQLLAPPVSPPIDARIIELPAAETPAQPTSTPQSTPKSIPKIIQPHPVAPPAPPQASLPQPPALPSALPPTPSKTASSPPTSVPAKTSPDNSQTGTAQMGAHAIYQPKPVIPEDLRDETIHMVVLARFHISAEGNVTVELIKPAPDPRINQIVLTTLKTWRYFPAIQSGKPVASTEDVQVAIDVGD